MSHSQHTPLVSQNLQQSQDAVPIKPPNASTLSPSSHPHPVVRNENSSHEITPSSTPPRQAIEPPSFSQQQVEQTPVPPAAAPASNVTNITGQDERGGNDTQHYDQEAVRKLLKIMSKIGYGDRKKRKKSMKALYEDAVKIAKNDHGIRCTA